MLAWLLDSLHLIALGIGLGALWVRARALLSIPVVPALRGAFVANSFWRVALLLWIATGLILTLGGVERPAAGFLENKLFLAKMALLIPLLFLEFRPAMTLQGWRKRVRRGLPLSTDAAATLGKISFAQAGLVVAMVFLSTAMTRFVL